jgi:tetratricopeptide (TPR) repeat protein
MSATARSLAAGLVLLAGAGALDLSLAGEVLRRPYDVVHVPSGAAARVVALGHRTFLSDMYWLATVQYVGDPRAAERGYESLFPLVDLVTDLDPRHGYAYQTAGIVLSANGRLEESNRILKKGVEKGPRWWTFPFYVAFNHWFYEGDYDKGAEWAEKAARTPGASTNISHLALSLRAKTGRPEDAVEMLREMLKAVSDEKSAETLDEQLKLAILERDAQALERAAAQFNAVLGRDPFSVEELVVAGLVSTIPEDPFGGRYVWNPQDGKVHSSVNPFRFKLREGPRHPAGFQLQEESP